MAQTQQFCTFYLDKLMFGVELGKVQEVIRYLEITEIPLAPRVVSGRATVYSFTVNHQQWVPGVPVPYVIGLVAIDEQPSLRLTTNIVGCPPDAVKIGMPVRATFEQRGKAWLPMFTPA